MNLHRPKNFDTANNNRINFLIAIVFLFGLLIVGRLFYLQVIKHGYYIQVADNQQQSEKVIVPERGMIYLQERAEAGAEPVLYPLAVNKQYALIYAIPRDVLDVKEAEDIASKVFFIFDLPKITQEVSDNFKKIDDADLASALLAVAELPLAEKKNKEAEIKHYYSLLHKDKTWLLERQKNIDVAIENMKKETVGKYLEILSRHESQYAPLQKKVDEEKLKRFYSLFLDENGQAITFDSLIIQNGFVYRVDADKTKHEIRPHAIYHSMQYFRYYPENEVASQLLGFVRVDNNKMTGNYGLEGFFDKELSGVPGLIKTGVGAASNVNILNGQEYIKPQNGSDIILTIDRSIQFFACQKLKEAAIKHQSDSASLAVVEPKTGAVIAMCSWPDFDPNNYQAVKDISVYNNSLVFQQYEPGSVFKAITMGASINEGKITPDTTYDDKGSVKQKGWTKPIKNADFDSVGAHGVVSMTYALERSLNLGAIFAMQQIGAVKFAEYVKSWGFGERTGIELESESSGNINNLLVKKINELDADTSSFGQSISVTPLQMLMSYAAIANGGTLMKPYVVKEIDNDDGSKEITKPVEVRRVISEKTASLLGGMLIADVESGHSQSAKISGYYVAGKTGTAQVPNKTGYSDQTIHTFIGFAPADNPKFVMLIKFDNPKDFPYADYTATPLFKDIADFILKYYKAPKER